MSRSSSKDSVCKTPPLTFSPLKINTNIHFYYVVLEFFLVLTIYYFQQAALELLDIHILGWGRGGYGQEEGGITKG